MDRIQKMATQMIVGGMILSTVVTVVAAVML